LEEIVMALKTRKGLFDKRTDIRTEELYKTSRLVSSLTGILVQPNKAIVGANAFAHEAGIHQHGMLSEPITYEIMTPESVGIVTSKLVLGKHSGRHAFKARLAQLGYELRDEDVEKTFQRFKQLADKKKEILDPDLEAIVEDEIFTIHKVFELQSIKVVSGTQITPRATVRILKEGRVIERSATGDGPVDACYRAIEEITGIKSKLVNYSLKGVTGGKDALGEVTARVESRGQAVTGRGASTDIIEASAKAYLDAMNKLLYRQKG
jgi:2-isopropylmalate synthase